MLRLLTLTIIAGHYLVNHLAFPKPACDSGSFDPFDIVSVGHSFDYCNFMGSVNCSQYQTSEKCGNNGVTYKTQCDFFKAHCADRNITAIHEGPCERTTDRPTTTTLRPTTTPVLAPYCVNILNSVCHGLRLICATNGLTYFNQCEYEKAKCLDQSLHIKNFGACTDSSTSRI